MSVFFSSVQESFGSHATADPNHAVTTLSSLGSILGIPVAVSVEERSGDSETTNEREPRRVLAEGENAAARMIESLFAHLTDGAGPSNDAGFLINCFNFCLTMKHSESLWMGLVRRMYRIWNY